MLAFAIIVLLWSEFSFNIYAGGASLVLNLVGSDAVAVLAAFHISPSPLVLLLFCFIFFEAVTFCRMSRLSHRARVHIDTPRHPWKRNEQSIDRIDRSFLQARSALASLRLLLQISRHVDANRQRRLAERQRPKCSCFLISSPEFLHAGASSASGRAELAWRWESLTARRRHEGPL